MRLPLLAAIAVCVALPVQADSIARNGADWVRLTAKPCSSAEVLAHIGTSGEDPKDFRAALARINGTEYEACWRPVYDKEVVFLRYSDGDAGLVPFGDLKPVQGI